MSGAQQLAGASKLGTLGIIWATTCTAGLEAPPGASSEGRPIRAVHSAYTCLLSKRECRQPPALGEHIDYPWSNPVQLRRDMDWLRDLHDQLMVAMSSSLNEILSQGRSRRSWEVQLGTWLDAVIATALDQWRVMEALMAALADCQALLAIAASTHIAVQDDTSASVTHLLREESAREALLGIALDHLIALDGRLTRRSPESADTEPLLVVASEAPTLPTSFLRPSRNLGSKALEHVLAPLARLSSREVGPLETLVLAGLLRRRIELPVARDDRPPLGAGGEGERGLECASGLRARLLAELTVRIGSHQHAGGPEMDYLLVVCARSLPRDALIPLRSPTRRSLKAGRVWVSRGSLLGSSNYQRAIAAAVASGARVVALQHGANYGIYPHGPERHEVSVADLVGSWGSIWGAGSADEGESARVLSLGRVALNRPRLAAAVRSRSASQREVLLVVPTLGHLGWRITTEPHGALQFDWRDDLMDFVQGLTSEAMARLVVRFKPGSIRAGTPVSFTLPRLPEAARLDMAPRLDHRSARIGLCVASYPSTAMLDALRYSSPLISFWSSSLFLVTDRFQVVLDGLRQVGSHFEDAQEAAAFASEPPAALRRWWSSRVVARARRKAYRAWGGGSWLNRSELAKARGLLAQTRIDAQGSGFLPQARRGGLGELEQGSDPDR